MPQKFVIFDTDPGVDDAMALALLARRPEAKIAAITTVFGNLDVETTTRNACLLREIFGLQGVPVARGAAGPLHGAFGGGAPHVHGPDALGGMVERFGAGLSLDMPDARPAHQVIIDLARAYPGQVHLCAVGPLTNLARALQEAPEIVTLLGGVSVMGGAFGIKGRRGNVSPAAEANFRSDPHAADLCVTAAWPLRIIGLDVTEEVVMSAAFLDALAAQGGQDGRVLREIARFYQRFTLQTRGIDGVFAHDSLAVMDMLRPELFTMRRGPVRVLTDGIARGESIQRPDVLSFPEGDWDGFLSQSVAVGIDARAALAFYAETDFR